MPEGLGFWLTFWAGFALLDLLIEPTLSDTTRRTFHTDTFAGKAVFTACLGGGSYALWRHITKGS
jgi:hypothetical protein